MTLPKETNKLTRFIHEEFHEIARDKELLDVVRDFVSIVVERWDKWKEETLEKKG